MNTRTRTIVLYTALAVAVAGAGGLAYGAIASSGNSSGSKTATRLVSATTGTVSQTVSATGTVQPATSLDLNFASGGTLTAVNVKAGDKVKINQVLATIDPAQAQVALETAKANLAAAQQKLTLAQNPVATPQDPAPAVDFGVRFTKPVVVPDDIVARPLFEPTPVSERPGTSRRRRPPSRQADRTASRS